MRLFLFTQSDLFHSFFRNHVILGLPFVPRKNWAQKQPFRASWYTVSLAMGAFSGPTLVEDPPPFSAYLYAGTLGFRRYFITPLVPLT